MLLPASASGRFFSGMGQYVFDTLNAPADKLLLSELNKLGGHSAISGRYLQMPIRRYIILTLLLLTCCFAFGQELNWRTITGIITVDDEPLIGEPILIIGTANGTMTDINGEFCLIAPEDKTIFITIPQCFEQVIRELDVNTSTIKIKLNKRNKKLTEEALAKWESTGGELEPELLKLFERSNYQNELKKICR